MDDRELDRLVAEKVMGWKSMPGYNYWMTFPEGKSFELHELVATWRPSTDIAAAWTVVEKLRERFSNVSLCGDNGWGMTLWNTRLAHGVDEIADCIGPVNADTAPWAICLAALMAVGADVPGDNS